MADVFLDGMPNVNEELNKMQRAFAAGPYNALPLTGGNLTGAVSSTSTISAQVLGASTQILAGAGESASSIRAANNGSPGQAGLFYEVAALSVTNVPGLSNSGRFFWSTCSPGGGTAGSAFLMRLNVVDGNSPAVTTPVLVMSGAGDLSFNRYLTVGPVAAQAKNKIYANVAQFGEILQIGRSGSASPCFSFNGSDGLAGWGNPQSVFYVGKNSTTSRSINAAGTINASGADYAEYMVKSASCGLVAPGQIIGIDARGQLTGRWTDAVAFGVKSTDPCMVGGDRWGQHLGRRPDPVEPVPGETAEEWAARQASGLASCLVYDEALEAARQTVDRIAFAGQVPVNVLGATPGQYVVPVKDDEGIVGMAMDEDDMSLKQYMRAIGKVISIEDDGRARIIVKVA